MLGQPESMINVLCKRCGNPFRVRPFKVKDSGNYCSIKCFRAEQQDFANITLCTTCHETKPLEMFRKCTKTLRGYGRQCKACANTETKKRYVDNPLLRQLKIVRMKVPGRYELQLERQRASNQKLRKQVLNAYGDVCVCCGETEPQFLTVDHIYNDGNVHRQQMIMSGETHGSFYRWLRNNNFPKDRFQLLCYNCNMAKGRYGNCPHITQELCLVKKVA